MDDLEESLESGLLSIGPDVVAVVTFQVQSVTPHGVALAASTTGRGISQRLLWQALSDLGAALLEGVAADG